jgi:hypothetical protein
MLRRPSELPSDPREEGCSSTAFGRTDPVGGAVWNNLAIRGSAPPTGSVRPAVP